MHGLCACAPGWHSGWRRGLWEVQACARLLHAEGLHALAGLAWWQEMTQDQMEQALEEAKRSGSDGKPQQGQQGEQLNVQLEGQQGEAGQQGEKE